MWLLHHDYKNNQSSSSVSNDQRKVRIWNMQLHETTPCEHLIMNNRFAYS